MDGFTKVVAIKEKQSDDMAPACQARALSNGSY